MLTGNGWLGRVALVGGKLRLVASYMSADEMRPGESPAQRLRDRALDTGDDEPDSIIWSGVYSAKAMVGAWIGAAAATLILPLLLAATALRSNQTTWLILGILLAGLWLWLIGTAVYRKLSNFYELTSQRLKHREGILFRKANRIELIDIDDVSYRQGPIQAVMGLGTITIQSSDTSHPNLDMVGIADVKQIADKIDDARRAERRKRGLHIETV